MSIRDHGTQSSWHPLEEIHWPFKEIFVWVAAPPRIAAAYKDGCIKYLPVKYFWFVGISDHSLCESELHLLLRNDYSLCFNK